MFDALLDISAKEVLGRELVGDLEYENCIDIIEAMVKEED